MSDMAIYVKTDSKTHEKAQKTARALGLDLDALINKWLKQFVKTKKLSISELEEIPNAKTRAIMKQAEENLKKGNHSPIFKTGEEAVAWLEKQGI